LARLLLVVIGYVALGWVTRTFAVPPGYGIAFWPPAGWALAAVILWGWRMLPAIFIAALITNSYIAAVVPVTAAWLRDGSTLAGIAFGVSLQAWIAASLVRHYSVSALRLETPRDVLALVALGGIVGSLVSPTIAHISLWLGGYVRGEAIWQNWLAWWMGDAVGVIVLTPVLLLLAAVVRGESWRRITVVSTTMLTAVLALALLISQLIALQGEALKRELDTVSNQALDALELRVGRIELVLQSLERFIVASEHVSFSEFAEFASPLQKRIPGVRALQWLPWVEHRKRHEFIARGRNIYGNDFDMIEFSQGELRQAAEQNVYFPVLYTVPMSGNRDALGYVINSNDERRDMIERAILIDGAAVSEVIGLVQAIDHDPAILVARPVRKSGTIQGVVTVADELSELTRIIEQVAKPVGANYRLVDRASGRTLFTRSGSGVGEAAGDVTSPYRVMVPFQVADRLWEATFWFSRAEGVARVHSNIYAVLVIGSLLVGFIGILALLVTGDRRVIEHMIAEKTHALEQANQQLEALSGTDPLTRIANRRRLEEDLDKEWRRAAREQKPLTLAMIDIDHFKRINDAYGHLFGDKCLRAVADTICNQLHRPGDLCGRYGGEEFAVFFICGDEAGALVVLERIRKAVADLRISTGRFDPTDVYMTISIGAAQQVPPAGQRRDWQHLMKAADSALYQAKRKGRNQVVMSDLFRPADVGRVDTDRPDPDRK
jgi:diguanylate cyclase (GGDEF)-like protein